VDWVGPLRLSLYRMRPLLAPRPRPRVMKAMGWREISILLSFPSILTSEYYTHFINKPVLNTTSYRDIGW